MSLEPVLHFRTNEVARTVDTGILQLVWLRQLTGQRFHEYTNIIYSNFCVLTLIAYFIEGESLNSNYSK